MKPLAKSCTNLEGYAGLTRGPLCYGRAPFPQILAQSARRMIFSNFSAITPRSLFFQRSFATVYPMDSGRSGFASARAKPKALGQSMRSPDIIIARRARAQRVLQARRALHFLLPDLFQADADVLHRPCVADVVARFPGFPQAHSHRAAGRHKPR